MEGEGSYLKKKSLGVNALLNSLQSLLNLLFPLITFPYISRTLSVDGVGKYNFSSSIVSYFQLISALGISVYAVREGAKWREDRAKFSEFASHIFTLNLASMLVAYILLFVTLALVPNLHKYTEVIIIFSTQIFFTVLGTDWIYTIFEEYGYITARNILFKIISIICLFIFVREKNDYINYALITVLASSGSYIINFFHVRKFCDIRINWHFDWKAYLIPILTIFGSTVAIQIYVSADTTLLGFMQSDYVVGIYSTATKIYTIVSTILTAMLTVTIPRLALLMGQKRMEEYNQLLKNVINSILAIVIPGCVGLFMVSRDVILIISSEKYLRATVSLQILSFAILGSALSTIFNQCALMPAKRERKSLISFSVSAVVNIGLNLILIPLCAEVGASWTTLLSQLLVMGMNYYFSRDITGFVFKDKQTWKNIASYVLGSIGIVVVCLVCDRLFSSMILRLGFSVILSGVAYAAILLALKNSVALGFAEQIKERIRN